MSDLLVELVTIELVKFILDCSCQFTFNFVSHLLLFLLLGYFDEVDKAFCVVLRHAFILGALSNSFGKVAHFNWCCPIHIIILILLLLALQIIILRDI